jgi:GNAT superfamily N-acetyltransferase
VSNKVSSRSYKEGHRTCEHLWVSSELQIRRYDPQDRDAVGRLHMAGRADYPDCLLPQDQDLLDVNGIYLEKGEFLVGLVNNRIIAMAGILPALNPGTAEVRRVRVDPKARGRGYAASILRALEERARQLGYRRLHLDTGADQLPAQALYRACGYREVGPGVIGPFPVVFFEKDL